MPRELKPMAPQELAIGEYELPPLGEGQERVAFEQEHLEMTPSAHPMACCRQALAGEGVTPAAKLAEHVGETVRVAGILVASRRARTRENLFMEFLTLEDETALVEVTLFPRAYQKFGHLIRSRGPFLVEGTVESQSGAVTLSARRLRSIPKPSSSPKDFADVGNKTVQ